MTIADLVGKVRQYDPSLDEGWLERVYEVADRAHEGQHRASGESYIAHPLGGGRRAGRSRDGPGHHRRGAAARRGRGHGDLQRAGRRGVRGRDRGARRRRHQADPHPVSVQRGRAGGEPAQDVPRDGQGHPGHHHQARRPPAQHAHAVEPAASPSSRRSRARRSRSTRRSRTASASGASSGIWKTSRCATSIPTRTATSPSASRRSASSARTPSRTSSPI